MTNELLLAVGVDGAPKGWVAAACWGPVPDCPPRQRRTTLEFFSTVEDLAEWRARQPSAGERAVPVAIDIPIGLPETVSYRRCDADARERLKGNRVHCVFQAPARGLLPTATELHEGAAPKSGLIFKRAMKHIAAEQAAVSAAGGGAKLNNLSQQAAGILGKVAAVDAFLQARLAGEPERQSWLVEVHPEVIFQLLNEEVELPKKESAHGQVRRLALIREHFPDCEDAIAAWPDGRRQSLLDIVDAYAGLWSALRWATTRGGAVERRNTVSPPFEVLGETEPGKPEFDASTGLLMRMVV